MRIETTYKWECIYKMDGEIFISNSYKSLVEQMRMLVYSQPSSNSEHRIQTKQRFFNWDKTILDPSNDKAFVLSLIDCGYLRLLSYSRKPLRAQETNQ